MGDPLSAVASIVTLLQVAGVATLYLKNIKHGSADRVRLRDELRSAVCLLEMLKDRIEDSVDTASNANGMKPLLITSLAGPDGPLSLFKQVLDDITKKLAPQNQFRKLSEPFTWPFDKKDIVELLTCFERLKSHFSLFIQNDLLELTKLSNLKLDDIGQKVASSDIKSREREAEAEVTLQKEEERNIIQWISATSFRTRHVDVLESVEPGTGIWLLEHDSFRRWAEGKIDILWCPGIPGAGKTRIVSLIVDYLERQSSTPNTLNTYIYCDYTQKQEQSTTALLSIILQQILQQCETDLLPLEVSALYNLHKKFGTRPTISQIKDVLKSLTSKSEITYVIIDALDECAHSEEDALQFVSTICSLGSNIKLLCTSRFSTIFEAYFGACEKVEISAQISDIKMFLNTQIQQQYRLSRHIRTDPTLKEEIINTISAESQGMFLLAKLHVESLSQKINRKEVRLSLQTLPATLDNTYSDAMQRISNQAPDAVDLAESVLFWVLCARRPLTVLELQHIYATRELPELAALDEDDLPDEDILTGVCGGLVIVDKQSRLVRAVHYTAQQYFERSHKSRLVDASGACTTDLAMSQRLKEYPFIEYSSKYWGVEGHLFEGNSFVANIQRFVANIAAVEAASQVWALRAPGANHWSQEFPRQVPALVLAAAFDLPIILRHMVSDGHDIERNGSDHETALIRAASHGQASNVQVLLELGAAINAQDHMNETALHRATSNGHESVVKLLVDGKADVNLKGASDWAVLMSAVAGGNVEIVQMLIQAGADLMTETVWGDSALSIATRNGKEDIAILLADSGATLPQGPTGRRASVAASRRGLHSLVRRLTIDYTSVAERPLRRQTSKIMRGIQDIQEEKESEIEMDDQKEHFAEVMEASSFRIGFLNRYTLAGAGFATGHSAEVFLGASKVTGVQYAVKVFRVKSWKNQFSGIRGISGEIEMLRDINQTNHPNIIQLIDVFAAYDPSTIYMVLEMAAGGELFNLIVSRGKLSEDDTRIVFLQLFSVIKFMHDQGWVHRDIKPENLLFSDLETLTLKVADFGLAKKLKAESGLYEFTSSLVGTPSYVAPEVLEKANNRYYGLPVDIWSSGVVLYICLCGFPPFSDELNTEENPYTLTQQILMGRYDYPSPYWDPIGDIALDLIDRMIVVDAEQRFTVDNCIEHPWSLGSTTREI